jgi:hypothetical protein
MGNEVQEMVLALIQNGMTPHDICERMDHRVSSRTVYRWAKGDCSPQNRRDREVLEKLASSVTGSTPSTGSTL